MDDASSDSFHFGLKALLADHPQLRLYASRAYHFTELIETYGDALKARQKYRADGADHKMVLAHYDSVCRELEEHLAGSLSGTR